MSKTTAVVEMVDEDDFPPRPKQPAEEDCCGSGCSQCVFDVYEESVKRWERQCREIREGKRTRSECVTRVFFLSGLRYKSFQLKNVVDHTHDTKIYTFQAVSVEDGDEESIVLLDDELGLQIGQHIIMRGKGRDGSNISRAYTPIRVRPGEFDILVKLYPEGEMSRHFTNLNCDDVVHFRGPYGSFTYRPNTYRRILMLCAGTGIAPMIPIVDAIVKDDHDETFVRLLSCVQTCENILLREELRTLAGNWNFTTQFHISKDVSSNSSTRYGENIKYDRLDKETLQKELNERAGEILVLVCGNQTFSNDMTEYALALGVYQSNIYVF